MIDIFASMELDESILEEICSEDYGSSVRLSRYEKRLLDGGGWIAECVWDVSLGRSGWIYTGSSMVCEARYISALRDSRLGDWLSS